MIRGPLSSVAVLAFAVSAGCTTNLDGASGAAGTRSALPGTSSSRGHAPVSQYLSHVIVIIQENRSLENFFAGFAGANAPTIGCASPPGTKREALSVARPQVHRASSSGCPPGDSQVPLHQITFDGPDLQHNWNASIADWDSGKMDGFWQADRSQGQDLAYAYVDHSETQPYWSIAQQYVLADAMFPTEFGGSFTGHLTLVAGTDNIQHAPSEAEVDFPSAPPDDCDSPPGTRSSYLSKNRVVHHFKGPFPCFDQFNTIAEVLDNGGVSWKYYATKLLNAGFWEPFEAISYVRKGPDWSKNIIAPQTKILSDPGAGQLASVSWVSPSQRDSDHPAFHSDRGPSWVASVVNAIGESSYWNSSAIIVLWDDWGGWYDNAPPPQLDYRGLGIRVPCLIISPYARETSPSQPGYVSHTQYEFGSILQFIEEVFGLPYIGKPRHGYTDKRANSLDDAFDFTQAPRSFTPIQSKYPTSVFLREPPSYGPVDTE